MIQVQRLDKFTIVTNEVLKNPKLSLKAKGLYSYLVSNAADFVVYMSEVEKHSTDGKDGHRAAWNELSKAGWISSVKTVGAGGKFDGWDHTIITDKESYKYPTKSTEIGLSDIGLSDVGKPATNKYQQVINTNSNKNIAHLNTYEHLERFKKFWKEYPKKVDRKITEKLWLKLKPSSKLSETIINSLIKQKASKIAEKRKEGWTAEWKLATTWLNGECWTDELTNNAQPLSKQTYTKVETEHGF